MRAVAVIVIAGVIAVLGWMAIVDAAIWEVEHRREEVESQTRP